MFHIFSLVCLLIYGVKSRSGHDRSQSFVQISYASGPKLTFLANTYFSKINVFDPHMLFSIVLFCFSDFWSNS